MGKSRTQMGMAIANPTDMHETLSCLLGSNMGKIGVPNGEHIVPSWARYIHIRALWVDRGPGGFTSRPGGCLAGTSGFTSSPGGCP
jgi:hypothetical protein